MGRQIYRSGNITLNPTIVNSNSITSLQFKVDGVNIGSEITSPPFTINYDTTALINGEHTFSAVVKDAANNNSLGMIEPSLRLRIKFDPNNDSSIDFGNGTGAFLSKPQPSFVSTNYIRNYNDPVRGNVGEFNNSHYETSSVPTNFTFTDTDTFTISAFIYIDSLQAGDYFGLKNTFIYKGKNDASCINYCLQVNDAHSISFVARVPGNNLTFYNWTNLLPSSSLIGRWTHVMLESTGTTITLYIDNTFISTKNLTTFVDSNTALTTAFGTSNTDNILRIGGLQNTIYIGKLDDVRIYQKNLSTAQRTNVFNGNPLNSDSLTCIIENIPNANATGGTPSRVRGANTYFKYNDTYQHFLTIDEINELTSWGANVQRVNISNAVIPGGNFATQWPICLDGIESIVQIAQTAGIKCIIDMHFTPWDGYAYETSVPKTVWDNPTFTTQFMQCWTDIATRLLPYASSIYAYELYNEPVEPVTGYWRNLAIKLIGAIRAVDQNVWIVYDPAPLAYIEAFAHMQPLPDKRIIYSFHLYRPREFCAQGLAAYPTLPMTYPFAAGGTTFDKNYVYALMDLVKAFEIAHNVPIFVGEFSVVRWAPHADSLQWLADMMDYFETAGWSWTYFHFREALQGQLFDLEYSEVFGAQTLLTAPSDAAILLKSYLQLNNI